MNLAVPGLSPIIPRSLRGAVFDIYVIYDAPLDGPDHYVVWRWMASPRGDVADPEPVGFARSVRDARQFIPDESTLLPRSSGDDPSIRESWF